MNEAKGGGDGNIAARYREVWLVDTEYRADRGERPCPVCLVARELKTGQVIRLWRDELLSTTRATFDVGPDCLMVAYAASAEIGCFQELGWQLPANILDLYFEHRTETNGIKVPGGNGLLQALAYRGLEHIDAAEKGAMRQLIIGQTSWTSAERVAILDYCRSDVDALAELLPRMAPTINLPFALQRGRYAKSVANIERRGVPLDRALYQRFTRLTEPIRLGLIDDIDAPYGAYESGVFKQDRFASLLMRRGIPWPRTASGRLAGDDDTFQQQVLLHPELSELRELRRTLDATRQLNLPIGKDGCARCSIRPFMATSGRNQPLGGEFIFAQPKWARGFIRPQEGCGLGYVDFAAQEVAIGAALSGDPLMIRNYESGDPYLAFGKRIGLAPPDATASTHAGIRTRCKAIMIGVNYGMGVEALAAHAGVSRAEAIELLRHHKSTYPRFWRWIDNVIDLAMLTSTMSSSFGWKRQIGPDSNPRSIANFPMQADGAEMLRITAVAATEAGIEVCALIHDACLIAAPVERLDEDVARMRDIMTKAGNVVTGGLDVRTEATVVRWPDRYMSPGGEAMWSRVMALLERIEATK